MKNVLVAVKTAFQTKMITERLIALGASLEEVPLVSEYVGLDEANRVVYVNRLEGLSVEVDVADVMTAKTLDQLQDFAC